VVQKKSEEEIKIEKKLSSLGSDLMSVFNKFTSGEKLSESLLRQFVSLTTQRTEKVQLISSINHTIAIRKPGIEKPFSEVGSVF
jgi:hypothetical protein